MLILLFAGGITAIQQSHSTEARQPATGLLVERLISAQPLTLPDARDSNLWQQTAADRLNGGFDTREYWLRIPLQQPRAGDPSVRRVLSLDYPLLDYVTFYLTAGGQLLQTTETGNNLPYQQRPLPLPVFALPIAPHSAADTLYVRVHTSSSVNLSLSLLPEAAFWQARIRPVTADAAFHAVLLCMVAYNLLIFALTRDWLFLMYSASIASISLMMAGLHGWTYAFLWPRQPALNDVMVLLSLSLSEVFTALFALWFLRLQKLRPGMYRMFMLFIIVAAMLGVLSLAAPYSVMIRLLTGLSVVMTIGALIMGAILLRQTPSRDVFLFLLAISLLVLGLLLYALQTFGVLPSNLITQHGAEIGHVSQVILLALGLAERHNRERQARIAAQDVIISMQRETNAMLDQKVRERTADLERANRRLQEESTTDALTQTRNRRYFDQRFYTLYQEAFRRRQPLALLLVDIDHFKQFNDSWGHQLGDQVLQQVARALQQVIRRPADAVYRYGGEEFAVLLPDTGEEGALQVAEQLRRRVASLRIWHEERELKLTVSVGVCALTPQQREAQQELYEATDRALYQAKELGRNRVCATTTDAGN